MRCRVDIRHPLLCIYCLWHNRARKVQLVKGELSRGVLCRIGAFFVETGRFLNTPWIIRAFFVRIEFVLNTGPKSMVS